MTGYKNNNSESLIVYVELMDEETETWRHTHAVPQGNGLYKLLPSERYDPKDEAWAYLPEEIVAVEALKTEQGKILLVARHPNPDVVRILVGMIWKHAVTQEPRHGLQPTHALPIGNGLYRVLATPQYNPAIDDWEFPPDSIVRLEEMTYTGIDKVYLLAVAP